MKDKKELLRIVSGLIFLFFLTTIIPGAGTAAPAEKSFLGMDWGQKYWPTKPVRGGIFNTAGPLYIGMMNPFHIPVNDFTTMSYFYEKLILNDGTYKPSIPWLAESWKYLNDVTVVMKLRQDVQFHDGTPFNAEGLKYQMEWIKDLKNGAWNRSFIEPLESVEVVDTYTVKWHFKRPWANFDGVMAGATGYVISHKALKADVALRESKALARQVDLEKKNVEQAEKEAAGTAGEAADKAKVKLETARKKLASLEEEYKKTAALAAGAKELDSNPVGTGPFMFDEGSPGNYLKLKRNPSWWFAKFIGHPDMPYFDGIKNSVIPDPSVRLANLRAGKLDSMAMDPTLYPVIKNDRSLQVFVNPHNGVIALRFNLKDGPCKDIRVRKAVSHALDRKALINGVDFGLGRPASGMYPSDHWAHNPELKPISYDPSLSKKLLEQAGYKKGLTIRGYMANTPMAITLSEAVKGMLSKVGITWNVELLDPAAMSERMRKVDYDLAAGGYAWIFDPDLSASALYLPTGGYNFGRSNNQKAISLIEAGRRELDLEKRKKIYWDLDKVLYDNYEDAWLWYPMAVTIFRKNVQGWNNPMYLKYRDGFFFSHPLWFKGGKS